MATDVNTDVKLQVRIKSTILPDFSEGTLKWCLDHPKANQFISVDDQAIEIRGWILTKDNESVELILRRSGSIIRHSLNRERPDVIEKVLHEPINRHPQLACGFSVCVTAQTSPIEIGFAIGHAEHWVSRVSFDPVRKVLSGTAGYLFLANDSNRSIDQYEGRALISDAGLRAWDDYFSKFSSCGLGGSVFLIAPAKEFVLPDCYPHQRALVTPVDQILQHFASLCESIIYPIEELKRDGHVTYSTGDTHWTDYGAFIAAKAICDRLGISNPFRENFPNFKLVPSSGDLIGKLDPNKQLPLFVADFSSANFKISFDNHIPNHGRVYVIENDASSTGLTAVLFGDSFSNNMSHWLALVFKRILVVHTAGAIDKKALEYEKPNFLIAQSNSRFLTTVPSYGLDLERVISDKVKCFSLSERISLDKKINAQSESFWKEWMKDLLMKIEPTSQVSSIHKPV